MHYGINPLLLSMQKLGPRMKCACCCLSHYCHCAIWAMLSCRVISSFLHTFIHWLDPFMEPVQQSTYLSLSSSSRSRSWVSVSIRLFPHWPLLHHHCPCRHAAETAVTQTNITTQVLAQQTHRAPQLICPPQHHRWKMNPLAATWIRYITVSQLLSYNNTLALVTEPNINNQQSPLCGLSLYKQCSRDSTVTEVMYLISV